MRQMEYKLFGSLKRNEEKRWDEGGQESGAISISSPR